MQRYGYFLNFQIFSTKILTKINIEGFSDSYLDKISLESNIQKTTIINLLEEILNKINDK